jgi:hypothetical protein
VEGVRIDLMGPVIYGPTGPSNVTVLAVPTGGTHINLDEPQFFRIQEAAKVGIPFILAADNSQITYAWALVGSGLNADPKATVYGPTAMNSPGVLYADTRTVIPERAPEGVKGLVVRSNTAAIGATGMLRIWRTG